VRCAALVHSKDRLASEIEQIADIYYGDLRDSNSIHKAMEGVEIVIHCAAITKNNISWDTHHQVNVLGSETIFKEAINSHVHQVIYASSVIVYGLDHSKSEGYLSENSPIVSKPDNWAYYMRSKSAADNLAFTYYHDAGLPITILRLGILYGEGGDRSIGRGLLQLGRFRLLVGNGKNTLPYTYIGNAVDAILLTAISPGVTGQAYNIVDEPQICLREIIEKINAITKEHIIPIAIPTFILSSAAGLLERRGKGDSMPLPPKLSRYVIRSACRDIIYDTQKAREQLRLKQEIDIDEGLRRVFLNQKK
jgi:2-alkyl-3-oxoalkanoate reductase